VQEYLGGITSSVRQLVTAMEEVVWTVNPRNDSLTSLAAFLSDYTERFLAHACLSCRLEVAPDLPSLPLSAPIRHNLLMAVKEALNNAAKHARASKVWLRLRLEGSLLCIEVADDGRGFDAQALTRLGNGLQNMRTRLESIRGSAEIRSETGKGTTVSLKVPLDRKTTAGA
jgi:signal transduction histidine kinase